MALQLAAADALVFGDTEGRHRNGEHVSRQFTRDVQRCREALGEDALPVIRLHDLRHTHATLLLTAREPVHVVSQRLGHASAVVTMTVYAHSARLPAGGRRHLREADQGGVRGMTKCQSSVTAACPARWQAAHLRGCCVRGASRRLRTNLPSPVSWFLEASDDRAARSLDQVEPRLGAWRCRR
jgi:hypothetical protein